MAATVVVSLSVSSVVAQTAEDRQVEAAAAVLDQPQWRDRERAFYALLDAAAAAAGGFRGRTSQLESTFQGLFKRYPACKDDVALGLIRLLDVENHHVNVPVPRSEEYNNYLGDLLAAVGAIHDRRAIDLLLPNIGKGELVTRAIASFGSEAVDRVAEVGTAALFPTRQAAIITLGEMLDPEIRAPLSSVASARLKVAMLRGARDENSYVRIAAVEGLARIPGDDVASVLRQIAETDPFHRPADARSARLVYPVREAATKALLARGDGR